MVLIYIAKVIFQEANNRFELENASKPQLKMAKGGPLEKWNGNTLHETWIAMIPLMAVNRDKWA